MKSSFKIKMTSKSQKGFDIFYLVHIHFTNVQREATISYMLIELFVQETNSNSTKRQMNCSKNCNSKLLPISDNRDIYPSD